MANENVVNVTVLVEETHRDNLIGVANALKEKGFEVNESLGEIGVLIGSVSRTALSALSTVAGVAAVEEERADYRTQAHSRPS